MRKRLLNRGDNLLTNSEFLLNIGKLIQLWLSKNAKVVIPGMDGGQFTYDKRYINQHYTGNNKSTSLKNMGM